MKLLAILFLAGFSLYGASVHLAWDISPEPDVDSYTVLYGTRPGIYSDSIRVEGRETTETVISNLTSTAWYFALTAHNTDGLDSESSEEVLAAPPTKLRIFTYVQSLLPGDVWRNQTNFTSQILMKPGTAYRSEVYTEFVKPDILRLTTYIQTRPGNTNASWVNATNFFYEMVTVSSRSYRTLTFSEILP